MTSGAAPARLRSLDSCDRLQGCDRFSRIRSPRVVGIDVGERNTPIPPDDEPGRHRQCPAGHAVALRKVEAEALVDLDEIVGKFDGDAERLGDVEIVILDDRKRQGLLARQIGRVLAEFR
jgi:hypothetical protein